MTPQREPLRALTGVRKAGWCLAVLGQACREEKGPNKKTGGKQERIDGVHGARDPDVQVERRCFVSGMSHRKRGRKGEDTEKEVFEIHRRERLRRTRVRRKRDGVLKARILCSPFQMLLKLDRPHCGAQKECGELRGDWVCGLIGSEGGSPK